MVVLALPITVQSCNRTCPIRAPFLGFCLRFRLPRVAQSDQHLLDLLLQARQHIDAHRHARDHEPRHRGRAQLAEPATAKTYRVWMVK
ncbi:MAG: hypothetical protein EWM72_00775 [Nitrospira sp.]|nr:MAG: hypothetical protein EWM72_00775 [Nitrospira sp.]